MMEGTTPESRSFDDETTVGPARVGVTGAPSQRGSEMHTVRHARQSHAPSRWLFLALAFLAASLGDARPSEAADVVRGPYLTGSGQGRMVVRWRTDVNRTTGIWWGTEEGVYTNSIQVGPASIYHEVTLTGLAPDTRYYYVVGDATAPFAEQLESQWFDAMPAPGSSEPFSAWIFGDSGWVGSIPAVLRNDWYDASGGEHPDAWLLLGDNAYLEGLDEEYQAGFFEPFQRPASGTPVWSTRGNHDGLLAGGENDYYDFFDFPTNAEAGGIPSASEAYYSFDHSNVHFICLDSEGSPTGATEPMLTWLQADLAATEQDWIVVFFHHPPYSKGSHNSDSEGKLIIMRERVVPILEEYGVDFVFSGHSHSYERTYLIDGHYGLSSTFDESMLVDGGDGDPLGDGPYVKPDQRTPHSGTVYTVVGTGSIIYPGDFDHPAIFRDLFVYGALYLEFDGLTATATFHQNGGQIRDRFAIEKRDVAGLGSDSYGVSPALVWASPNPSSDEHRIQCFLTQPGRMELSVFDSAGRKITGLFDGHAESGRFELVWPGRSSDGTALPSGVYFAKGSFSPTRGAKSAAGISEAPADGIDLRSAQPIRSRIVRIR